MYIPFEEIKTPRHWGYTVVRVFHVWLTSASRSVWYDAAPTERDDGQTGPQSVRTNTRERNPKLPVLQLQP